MWELYAFWAFVPITLSQSEKLSVDSQGISYWSFVIIGLGSVACFIGGFLSENYGPKKMATLFLLMSGICCLISPFTFAFSSGFFLAFLIVWGLVVIADSPLFSTLIAQQAEPQIKGSALTLVTSIGFAITILSIQLLSYLIEWMNPQFIYLTLFIGPLFGLVALRK